MAASCYVEAAANRLGEITRSLCWPEPTIPTYCRRGRTSHFVHHGGLGWNLYEEGPHDVAWGLSSPSNATQSVLVVDDDARYCRLLGAYLAPHGFDVAWTREGAEAVERVRSTSFSSVILDVLLPGVNGFHVLRKIRAISTVPILMVTACTEEADRVMGLENGADDYVSKTTSPREVLARLRALIRRAHVSSLEATQHADLVVGELKIDFRGRNVQVAGKPVALTQIEFDLLASLARCLGGVLSREQLITALWADHPPQQGNAINVHISMLRKKLGDDAEQPLYIHTVRGIGYKLVGPPQR
jgi:DNA-binding response OmpR family regulator